MIEEKVAYYKLKKEFEDNEHTMGSEIENYVTKLEERLDLLEKYIRKTSNDMGEFVLMNKLKSPRNKAREEANYLLEMKDET